MVTPRALPVWFLAVAACCPPPAATTPVAQPTPPEVTAPVATAPPAEEVIDRGRFELVEGGQPGGTESFELRRTADGLTLDSDVDDHTMGSSTRGHLTLVTDARWRPLHGEATLVREKGGVTIKATAHLDGGPDHLVLSTSMDGGAAREERAPGPVDFYIDTSSVVQLMSLCTIAEDGATLTSFPGLKISVGQIRTHETIRTVPIDVAGAVAMDIHCEGERLLAVDIPMMGMSATREGAGPRLAELRRKPREKPTLPDGLVELDRKVEVERSDAGPATLACSLLVPASHRAVTRRSKRGPTAALPAVVFITGSGRQDRDEDSYGPGGLKMSIFKVIAIELGKAGVASLRCDDRGGGGSTGDFSKATLDTFVADTAATVAALRAEPAVDPARIGLVGHSEGGIVAPLVATRDRKLRALVLMAGTGRPIDVILQEQATRALTGLGKPADEVAAEMAQRQAVFDAMRAGKPLPDSLSPDERTDWEPRRGWLASHLRHSPAATAAKLSKVAVMIAQGDVDQQVAVADADALAAAFAKAHNRKVTKKVYAGLNHLFAKSTTGDISEYVDPAAHVDETFLADLVKFVKAHL